MPQRYGAGCWFASRVLNCLLLLFYCRFYCFIYFPSYNFSSNLRGKISVTKTKHVSLLLTTKPPFVYRNVMSTWWSFIPPWRAERCYWRKRFKLLANGLSTAVNCLVHRLFCSCARTVKTAQHSAAQHSAAQHSTAHASRTVNMQRCLPLTEDANRTSPTFPANGLWSELNSTGTIGGKIWQQLKTADKNEEAEFKQQKSQTSPTLVPNQRHSAQTFLTLIPTSRGSSNLLDAISVQFLNAWS